MRNWWGKRRDGGNSRGKGERERKFREICKTKFGEAGVITSFAANGTIAEHLLNLGESLAGCRKYGNYKVEITETQRVDSTWLQQ